MRVFLGGTCNNSTWRDELIPTLNSRIDYFNPVIPNWTPECQEEEEFEKTFMCDITLYTITSEMTGVYSIAEVVDDSNKKPTETVLCILKDGFDEHQVKSLEAVAKLVEGNGAKVLYSLEDVAKHLESIEFNLFKRGLKHG